jgi:hypothetical protein
MARMSCGSVLTARRKCFMDKNKEEVLKSLLLANEFLKLSHGFKVDSERPDKLPMEIKEHLANTQLEELIERENIEPELIVWGLLKVIEILLQFTKTTPEELSEGIDLLIKTVRERDE